MKKIIQLIKNGTTYQVGSLSDSEVEAIRTDIENLQTATGTHATNISDLRSDVNAVSGKVETLENHKIFKVVTELPTSDIDEQAIYLVPNDGETGDSNVYIEYIYKGDAWEIVGKQQVTVDLSDYYTKSEVDTKVSESDGSWYGTQAQYDALAEKKVNINYFIYKEV